MPITQSVSADVDVGNQSFRATGIETTVAGSPNANSAVLTGYVDEPDDIEIDQEVTVEMNESIEFFGYVKEANEKKNNEITVEAYDGMYDAHNSFVVLNMAQPNFISAIARDLLRDFSFDIYDQNRLVPVTEDPDDAQPGHIYIEQGTNFPNNGDVLTRKEKGSSWGGEVLTDVLSELSNGIAGVFWTDKKGVIRFEPAPSRRHYTADYIIETEAGKESSDNDIDKVIVTSGSGSQGESASIDYTMSALGAYSEARLNDLAITGNKINRINDDNIITQKELDNRAATEAINHRCSAVADSITVVGTTKVRPWDAIVVPGAEEIGIASGKYMVSSVEQVLNEQDGWETTLQLSPDIVDVCDDIDDSGGSTSFISDIFTEGTEIAGNIGIG